MKKTFKGATLLYPLPAVMVSCGRGDEANIITVAWTGIVNSEPPMTYISVRPSRFSHDIIEREGEFVINLTDETLVYEMDYAGCVSGEKVNKWEKLGLTREAADKVACPMIAESPLNLECRIIEKKSLPSHDMFLAEIIEVHADEKLMNENGRLALERAGLVSLVHSGYHKCIQRPLGRMGYSVMKPSTKKRLAREGKRVGGAAPRNKKK